MKPTINPVNIARMFPCRGTIITPGEQIMFAPHGEVEEYVIPLTMRNYADEESNDILKITIPKHTDGLFEINGTYKVIISKAIPNFEYPNEDSNMLGNMMVMTFKEIILEKLFEAIESGLKSWYGGSLLDTQNIQQVMDSFFATSDLFRQVNPDKPLEIRNFQRCILLDLEEQDLSAERIIPKDWEGKVCLLSTPQNGDKICRIYRLNHDVEIKNGFIVDNEHASLGKYNLNEILEANALFLENSRRPLNLTSNLASSEELVHHEPPAARFSYYQDDLKGVHARTAIMATEYNFGDAFQISESFAQKMLCKVNLNTTFTAHGPVRMIVDEGTVVDRLFGTLAVISEKIGEDTKTIEVKAKGIKVDSIVKKIEKFNTKVLGKQASKYKISMESQYPMITGDKMTTRHGSTKGIVVVVPDDEMPHGWISEDSGPDGHLLMNKEKKVWTIGATIYLDNQDSVVYQVIDRDDGETYTVKELNGEAQYDVPFDALNENGLKATLAPVEVVMTPYGIMSRRSFGVIREMLVNKLFFDEESLDDTEMVFDHFDDRLSLESILEESPESCEKEQLYVNGEPLEHKSFVGPLYFIRLDKHARDAGIGIGEKAWTLNHKQLKQDNSWGGQKFTSSMYEMLDAKGAKNIADSIMDNNIELTAIPEMNQVLKALKWCDSRKTLDDYKEKTL